MGNVFAELEAADKSMRAWIAANMLVDPEAGARLSEQVIEEIGRRLRTMPPEVFIEAACDILRNSRIEPETLE